MLAAAALVLDFECVHPFADGNGRVGKISSAKGAKRGLVKNAIEHLLLPRFTVGELENVCKGISRMTLIRALRDLRAQGLVRCLGRGPKARWERIGR